MPIASKPEYKFDLSGGHPALDLANTVSRRDDLARRREHLASYADLISFAVQDRIVSPKEATELRTWASKHAKEAERSLRIAIDLREALYRVFVAIAGQKAAPEADLALINEAALQSLQNRRLTRVNGGYQWQWESTGKNALDRILWPIALAATELLTSDELKRVRWCEAPDCEWLFLDNSRNRSRRWCDMTSCGNRAKARRHYERTHQ